MSAPDRFAAALIEVFERLDWYALGFHYCTEGGADFFDDSARQDLLEGGIRFASAIVELLEESSTKGPRRSLYVGAAVSELGPMLGERLLLGRTVLAYSLDSPETRELNRCLAEVGAGLGEELPRIRVEDLCEVELPPYDHLWLVSVLNDPEAFPALHDELYERAGTELATGRGDLAQDLRRAERLCRAALGGLARPGTLTTSEEELPLVRDVAGSLDLTLSPLAESQLSPVVEDPVRSYAVSARR